MKRIIEKRSSKDCVSPPRHPTYLAPLSVCLSILCLFCISTQLGPVRFSNNQEQEKVHSNKGVRKKLAPISHEENVN
jgi:hypothetical protein